MTPGSSSLAGLRIDAGALGIRAVSLGHRRSRPRRAEDSSCRRQIFEYLDGKRTSFTLPLDLSGTPFQHRVWSALRSVPYGATLTYGQLAKKIGKPRAVRAVASAVARNPVAIIIPCHRIVPASGGTGKYRWGAARKRWLLTLEGVACNTPTDKYISTDHRRTPR